MNLEPEANDVVGIVGEDNAIKYSIAISLKRIADAMRGRSEGETVYDCLSFIGDSLDDMNQRQRNHELPEIDVAAIKARYLKGLE